MVFLEVFTNIPDAQFYSICGVVFLGVCVVLIVFLYRYSKKEEVFLKDFAIRRGYRYSDFPHHRLVVHAPGGNDLIVYGYENTKGRFKSNLNISSIAKLSQAVPFFYSMEIYSRSLIAGKGRTLLPEVIMDNSLFAQQWLVVGSDEYRTKRFLTEVVQKKLINLKDRLGIYTIKIDFRKIEIMLESWNLTEEKFDEFIQINFDLVSSFVSAG